MCFLPTAEDVVRKLAVPHSSVVSDGVTDDGTVHNGYTNIPRVYPPAQGEYGRSLGSRLS